MSHSIGGRHPDRMQTHFLNSQKCWRSTCTHTKNVILDLRAQSFRRWQVFLNPFFGSKQKRKTRKNKFCCQKGTRWIVSERKRAKLFSARSLVPGDNTKCSNWTHASELNSLQSTSRFASNTICVTHRSHRTICTENSDRNQRNKPIINTQTKPNKWSGFFFSCFILAYIFTL